LEHLHSTVARLPKELARYLVAADADASYLLIDQTRP